ncbi:hypothetical protein [uncultured Maribacter sp.]|uniref:hypothetical protein n=1 Tax=uncultured Maribacter sp. TaxID=431308 RepID=UPI00263712DA|nr:hypothetical protein [uncultured Maribacter sp.]
MRVYTSLIILILVIIFGSSCRKDFDYGPSSGNLTFSKDTVYLDTVFTNISSSTYSLKVYNPTRDDVNIPSIQLKEGNNSAYRLNVDGQEGKAFKNVPLFAQDSLYVFIEITQDISKTQQSNWLYTDVLQFDSGKNIQEIPLVTLIKDAVFLSPTILENNLKEQVYIGKDANEKNIFADGLTLTDEQLHFTNTIPYVIYGYASVPEGKQLIIDAGSRIHFHKNSGLVVQKNASIQINGTLSKGEEVKEGEVIFEGDRLEPELANIAGQWGAIILNQGSINNTINYTTIKNATTGVLFNGEITNPNSNLQINNSQIFNSANINLWLKEAKVTSKNLVIGSAGNIGLYCNLGGNYFFTHATIANYWINGFREGSALKIDNTKELSAVFNNCIIDGNKRNELVLEKNNDSSFNFLFNHCMITSDINDNITNSIYNFTNTNYYNTVFLNKDSSFEDAFNNIFNINKSSFAINIGDLESALNAPVDIQNTDRTSSPDLGAFEYFELNE